MFFNAGKTRFEQKKQRERSLTITIPLAQTALARRAPETCVTSAGNGRSYNSSADIWSLGCVFFLRSESNQPLLRKQPRLTKNK